MLDERRRMVATTKINKRRCEERARSARSLLAASAVACTESRHQ
jgi:hypothetical protein